MSDANLIRTLAKKCAEQEVEIGHLRNELAAAKERAAKYQSLAAELSDKLNGTPCAEIRWKQEMEALQEKMDNEFATQSEQINAFVCERARLRDLLEDSREAIDDDVYEELCERIDYELGGKSNG